MNKKNSAVKFLSVELKKLGIEVPEQLLFDATLIEGYNIIDAFFDGHEIELGGNETLGEAAENYVKKKLNINI